VQRHRNYLLKVLFVIQVFNAMDGWALGLVMQDIKLDLSLSDTQLGIMTGFAFALMYALAGLSIARWADRGDRVAIVSVTAAIWSVLVTACGTARNFLQLLLLRIGVGVGEAGCVPASQSLIADYFDRGERPRANALYMMGTGVSALIGYGLAGWLNELYGWRTMFMILGLPGLIVAALAWLTLREPRFQNPEEEPGTRFVLASRSLFKTTAKASAPPPRLWSVAVTLWSNKTVRHLLLFWAVSGFFTTAMWQWQPMFFVRSHGLNTGELGLWFAAVYGLGGMSGAFLGGACASRYANSNERLQLEVGAWICCALVLVSALIYWVPDSHLAF
jgi:MFS family permease